MRISTPKSTSTFRRPTPLRRKLSQSTPTSSITAVSQDSYSTKTPLEPKSSVSDSLAICLFGFTRTMFDSEYEEEMRKRAIMAEVLPDEVMWAAWAKNEAPLRQGRGWYPALDRHFLELLVISEIHCLSHPLHGIATPPGQAERIHRHASRVRRVACERIGAERLHAYCERVKEAFEAYMHGAWGGNVFSDTRDFSEGDDDVSTSPSTSTSTLDDDSDHEPLSPLSPFSTELSVDTDMEGQGGGEERGRKREKGEGSVNRMEHPEPKDLLGSPKSYTLFTGSIATEVIGEDPFIDQEMDKEEKELDRIVQELEAGGELLKINLEDVQEGDEEAASIDLDGKQDIEGMEIDVRIDIKSDSNLLGVPSDNLDFPTSVPSSPLSDKTEVSTSSAAADLINPSINVSSPAVRA